MSEDKGLVFCERVREMNVLEDKGLIAYQWTWERDREMRVSEDKGLAVYQTKMSIYVIRGYGNCIVSEYKGILVY